MKYDLVLCLKSRTKYNFKLNSHTVVLNPLFIDNRLKYACNLVKSSFPVPKLQNLVLLFVFQFKSKQWCLR